METGKFSRYLQSMRQSCQWPSQGNRSQMPKAGDRGVLGVPERIAEVGTWRLNPLKI